MFSAPAYSAAAFSLASQKLTCGNEGATYTEWDSPTVTDEAGAHIVGTPAFYLNPCTGSGVAPSPGTAYVAADNSGYTLVVTGSSYGNAPAYNIYDKVGNLISPISTGSNPITSRLVVSPNNVLLASLTQGTSAPKGSSTWNNTTTYTDAYSQTVLAETDNYAAYSATPTSNTFGYSDSSGNPQTYTMNYSNYSFATDFACPQTFFKDATGDAEVLPSSVSFPNGRSLTFSYEPTPNNSSGVTNRVSAIGLPSGGSISYTYSGPNDGIYCDAIQITEGTIFSSPPAVTPTLTRTVDDGQGSKSVWTYNFSDPGKGGYPATSVIDPANNETDYLFAGNYVTQVKNYQGSAASGTLLKTITTCYNGNFTNCANPSKAAGLISQTDVYTSLNGNSPSLTETIYNSSGVAVEVKEYLNGAAMPPSGLPARDTVVSYGTWNGSACAAVGNYINALPCETKISSPTALLSDVRNTYSATGNLTQTQRLVSGTTYVKQSFSYNVNGTLKTSTDGNSNVTTYNFAACNSLLPTSVSAGGLTVTSTWDCNGEVLTGTTGPNKNQTTKYAYADPFYRPTSVGYADGGATSMCYSDVGGSLCSASTTTNTTFTQILATPDPSELSSVTTDGIGRAIDAMTAGGANIVPTYTPSGYLMSVTNPYTSKTDPTYGITSFVYDALGRKTQQTQPDGATQKWSYSGNAVLFTDENGSQWKQTFDALGRLTTVLEPTTTSTTPTMETDYTYSVLNDLTRVDQWGGAKGSSGEIVRQFSYDGLSRLMSSNNPETGTTSYSYDGNSNLSKKTDARNVAVNYVYDALNRLTKKSYTDGFTVSALFGYDGNDSSGNPLSNSLNALGQLSQLSETADSSITAISYDVMGRIVNKNECIPGDCSYHINVGATYDLGGNVLTLTNGSTTQPITLTYTYDGAGRLGTITSNLTSGSYHPATLFNATSASPVSYGAAGMLQYAALGVKGTAKPALTLYQSYDNRERPVYENAVSSVSQSLYSVCIPATGNTNCTGSGGYAPNGNLAKVTDSLTGSWNYTYDDLNRLSTATASGGAFSNSPYGCWTYDNFGNRTEEAVSNTPCTHTPPPAPTTQATYNVNNQVTESTTAPGGYTYDAAGNVLNDGVNQYLYDGEGRVCAVKSSAPGVNMVQYIYDPAGSRVGKGTVTSFSCDKTKNGFTATVGYVLGINGEQLTEIDGSGAWQHTNVFADSKLLATYAGSDTYFAISDWLGTKRLVAGVGGCLSYNASLPFGNSLQTSGVAGIPLCPDASEHHYTGKERDIESGNDYFGARYYASSMGRFMSPDYNDSGDEPEPVPYADFSNPQSLNLYAYMLNNPMIGVDPDGHCGLESTTVTLSGGDNSDSETLQNIQLHVSDCLLQIRQLQIWQGAGNFAQQAASTVSQAARQLSKIAQTPGGPGCMAGLAASGGGAGAAVGGEIGLGGLAVGGVGVTVTEPAGLIAGGIGGAASGMAAGMSICPGGAAFSGGQGTSGGSRGSTGRGPKNLKEQLAAEQAASNPKAGIPVQLSNGMSDSRWLGSEGWEKLRQNINGVEVHYNYNTITQAIDDIKIK